MFDPAPTWSDVALICSVVCFALCILFAYAQRAAYRNGVCDGYGYSREPTCPGYEEAGRYLRRTHAHRWPELLEDEE